ncbi:MAG: acetylxylan esterase, partial [Candidatus Omnitrophica bacterium]|nr:acetylxylan esterase [Candidatus Omnitrophota bacterium]
MSAVFPSITKFCLLGLLFGLCSTVGYALDSQVFSDPAEHVLDGRLQAVRKIETFYSFPRYTDLAAWEARKAELRTHLWVSMGAYPEPPKTPLNAKIYDKMEFSDFAVEKAFFESLPGFYATGTLYRPKGKTGPFPAVLCPHGHWKEGRLTHSDENSIPTRCMNFAKQGFVVFAIDMVGYTDSLQIDHKFGGPAEWLWGLSLPGLQFWNSIRAVDFLASLPEVDPNRIGCTGASGGGTQTFNLMAADERVRFAAPVNMLSAHYQGGCLCENCPNSRIGAFNVEFGAMMAPRPLMM